MKMNFDEFAPLFGPWADLFRPFIESEEMFNIYERLKQDGRLVVPTWDNTYRSFLKSSPHNIQVVWYLMDPYDRRYRDGKNQATGIPMDSSNSPDGKLQPSLVKFYEGIEKDTKIKPVDTPNLEYLLSQGVLLLNTDLTTKVNKTGSHEGLWEPFQKYFLEEIMSKQTGIVYILSGNTSLNMEKYISPLGNYILKTEHPANAERRKREWKTENIFNNINKLVKYPIIWNSGDYDDNPPF